MFAVILKETLLHLLQPLVSGAALGLEGQVNFLLEVIKYFLNYYFFFLVIPIFG